MEKVKKQTKTGITLISLVITIILLLILATVAIIAAINGNGLFIKANQSKEEVRYDQIKEAKDLWEIRKETDIKTAEKASEVINRLYEEEKVTKKERDKLLEGETIIVANKEVSFIQENQLYFTLSKSYAKNYEYAVIYAMPKIGGIPEYQTYIQYIKPEEILATKDNAGKEEILVQYAKETGGSYFEQTYPGQEITIDLVFQDLQVSSMEELATEWNYDTVDEMIIGERMIDYDKWQAYEEDYRTNYRRYVTITNPDGSTRTVSNMNEEPYSKYAVLENGTYTFTATLEGQDVSKSIDITDIQQYKEMVLAKEDENTYIINCIEDLIKFSENVNNGIEYEGKTIKLMRNLDFNEDSSYENPLDKTTFGDYNGDKTYEGIKAEVTKATQRGFIPIGGEGIWIKETYQNFEYSFKGNFEGNNYTLSNLYINNDEINNDNNDNNNIYNLGLFAKNYGTIQNLKLNGNIKTSSTGYYVYYVGGFVADNYGTISNCENSVKFAVDCAYLYLGGIVGYNDNANITECENLSDITIPETYNIRNLYIGGILGQNNNFNSIIQNCINNGEINVNVGSTGYIGGITGRFYYSGRMLNCANLKNVTVANVRTLYLGGLAGQSEPGFILNCYNTGNVNAENITSFLEIGGLIGTFKDGRVANSYNSGSVVGRLSSEAISQLNIRRNLWSRSNGSN